MKRILTLLAATAAAAFAFSAAPVANAFDTRVVAHHALPVVYGANALERPTYFCFNPDDPPYTCGSNLQNLVWQSWGAPRVYATGDVGNFSAPCAVGVCGTFPATSIKLSGLDAHIRQPFYDRLSFRWQSKSVSGEEMYFHDVLTWTGTEWSPVPGA